MRPHQLHDQRRFSGGTSGSSTTLGRGRLQRPIKYRSSSDPSFRIQSISESYFSQNSTNGSFEYIKPVPTEQLQGFPKLDYKPFQLRTWFLTLSILFFAACFSTLAVLLKLSLNKEAPFRPGALYYYFAARYVPTIIGTVTAILWRSILSTLARMTPYISMAADRKGVTGTPALRSIQSQYFPFIHVTQLVRNGHLLLLAGYITNCFVVFLTPFKSTYVTGELSLTKILDSGANALNDTPTVTVSEIVSYVLLLIYGVLIVMTLTITLRLWSRKTGLKWDPVSLADQMQLCFGSNLLRVFKNSEQKNYKEFREHFKCIQLRLGYWKNSEGDIRHGIDVVDNASNASQQSLQRIDTGQSTPALPPTPSTPCPSPHSKEGRKFARARYANIPTFLQTKFLVLCILFNTGVLFFLFFSNLNGMFEKGFTLKRTSSFELYAISRFLPTLLAALTTIYWSATETYLRVLQPFAGMYHDGGRDARQNLLLQYPHCLPVEITIRALGNRHYKLALVSAISFLSTILPVIAGGTFVATPNKNSAGETTGFQIKAISRNIYIITAYFLLAAICLIILLPNRNRKLPRMVQTFADVISFCYASSIMTDKNLFEMTDHARDEQCHLYAKILLRKGKYAFGLYQSTLIGDYAYRLGFDNIDNITRIKYRDRVHPGVKHEEEGQTSYTPEQSVAGVFSGLGSGLSQTSYMPVAQQPDTPPADQSNTSAFRYTPVAYRPPSSRTASATISVSSDSHFLNDGSSGRSDSLSNLISEEAEREAWRNRPGQSARTRNYMGSVEYT